MDEIWDLIWSVSEGFPTYFCINDCFSIFKYVSQEAQPRHMTSKSHQTHVDVSPIVYGVMER